MKGIKNLTAAINAMNAINAAKTADATAVTAEVNARLAAAKENNKKVAEVESGLKASGMTDAAVDALMASLNLKTIDITAEEKKVKAEVQEEMDNKAAESFYTGLGEVAMLLNMFSEPEPQPAPKSPADVLIELQTMKLLQELNPASTPAPAPAPVPTTTAPTPAPTPIQSRKELGNELRSISAAARSDRAMIHADSVSHPFSGNYKEWGASLFKELADRATARSNYWANK